jgi:MFS family permease
MNLGVTENANSLANFQPTILKGLGYTATQAQVHTIPVYLVGAVFSVVFAYMSEWFQRRYYFYMLGWVVLASGLAVEIVYPANPKVRYMGMFFIACGCYLAMPISIIWVSINCGSGYQRAVAIAAIINFGTAGAFVSSNVFLFTEAPKFHTGFSTGLGLACMGALAATLTYMGCKFENRNCDLRREELPNTRQDETKRIGDIHPEFRFSL